MLGRTQHIFPKFSLSFPQSLTVGGGGGGDSRTPVINVIITSIYYIMYCLVAFFLPVRRNEIENSASVNI